MTGKRDGYISWDEYFMGVAKLSGMRSKDPNSQVGACIVSSDNKILSMGYNGFPMGCSDDEFPWAREGEDELDKKYLYVTHSVPWKGQSCMCPCFPAMNAPRRSSRQGSRPLSMSAINMRIRRQYGRPNGCWTQRESGIISTIGQEESWK